MTDITELEQKPTRYGTNSQGVFTNQADGAYVSYQDFLVVVEALEKAQAKNALVAGGIEASTKLHERIAELDAELEREREKSRRVMSRIAELESRTVTVKLPRNYSMLMRNGFDEDYQSQMAFKCKDIIDAITSAGIKWEAE